MAKYHTYPGMYGSQLLTLDKGSDNLSIKSIKSALSPTYLDTSLWVSLASIVLTKVMVTTGRGYDVLPFL